MACDICGGTKVDYIGRTCRSCGEEADEMSEHTRDWCRMPDDPFTGRFPITLDCPACDERLAEELRQSAIRQGGNPDQ